MEIGGDRSYRRRLLEMGLLPGVELQVVRKAPLGDPLEVRLRGFRVSLRRREAAHITVGSRRAAEAATEAPRDLPQRPAAWSPNNGTDFDRRWPLARAAAPPHFRIALAGNPNTGKSTLFNALTGGRARIGNYPGITVDRRSGRAQLTAHTEVEVLDVPGAYSLCARTHDEQLAIDTLLGAAGAPAPQAVVVLLSATALERSLYLLLQLQELSLPLIGAINMIDEARRRDLFIDPEPLERAFGVPFVPISARHRQGLDVLKERIDELLRGEITPRFGAWSWRPGDATIGALEQVAENDERVAGEDDPSRRYARALWALMSADGRDGLVGLSPQLRAAVSGQREQLASAGVDLDLEAASGRYAASDSAVHTATRRLDPPARRRPRSRTSRVDALLTHPLAGLVVFLTLMALIFTAMFDWATPLMDLIDGAFSGAAEMITAALPGNIWAELLADGLLRGVGSVVVFVPQIAILLAFLALLEGSGYMARAAFMMDRVMRKLGLNGRAFVPLMSGYACAIPAILSTRTMDNHRDRLLTMMVVPLVSCSARLPIYTLIVGTLFAADRRVLGPLSLGALMMLGLYALSMVFALVAAGVIGRTVLKGRRSPLLLELPPYRLPVPRTVLSVVWHKVKMFLKTAGTVIVVISVILWALLNIPRDTPSTPRIEHALQAARAKGDQHAIEALKNEQRADRLRHSYAGRIGRAIEPIIAPLGFDWKIGIGLIGSFAAREVFVATMGLVYGAGESDEDDPSLRAAIRTERRPDGTPLYTPLTGLSLLVFFMLAMQCMSTLAVTRQESRSWRWPLFMLGYLTALAYVTSLAVYQIGQALGFS